MGIMNTIDINEVQDIARSIDINNLLISAHAITHSYEHDTLDESDLYNLLRDVLDITTSIKALQDALN